MCVTINCHSYSSSRTTFCPNSAFLPLPIFVSFNYISLEFPVDLPVFTCVSEICAYQNTIIGHSFQPES